ncbi:nuclear transport factor 2 family protein [Microtetraspora niveoalba]|uniref:nuclear transport factor 2 family protein n=1 Tax=Microtetraspora niveoalba TaxID=46175 RepID=UPI000ABCFBCC|nr:nuclear transport factor 2 family protein [Microtetraspora niveoalba]
MNDLEARVRRLEAVEEIRQLVSRYALALDGRDVTAMAALFVEDVRTHGGGVGREALAEWFGEILRPFTTTFHLVGNHVIDFVDEDRATGVVYCRPEHEVGDLWVVMPMQYWDRYERRDGHWYFASRSTHVFYAADVGENPLRVPGRFNFPGNPFIREADLPERWESWRRFWSTDPADGARP